VAGGKILTAAGGFSDRPVTDFLPAKNLQPEKAPVLELKVRKKVGN
tara:strand:- start:99 stop:236 length:138 start_codon:yes stop_codon:yes gene_type:complete